MAQVGQIQTRLHDGLLGVNHLFARWEDVVFQDDVGNGRQEVLARWMLENGVVLLVDVASVFPLSWILSKEEVKGWFYEQIFGVLLHYYIIMCSVAWVLSFIFEYILFVLQIVPFLLPLFWFCVRWVFQLLAILSFMHLKNALRAPYIPSQFEQFLEE